MAPSFRITRWWQEVMSSWHPIERLRGSLCCSIRWCRRCCRSSSTPCRLGSRSGSPCSCCIHRQPRRCRCRSCWCRSPGTASRPRTWSGCNSWWRWHCTTEHTSFRTIRRRMMSSAGPTNTGQARCTRQGKRTPWGWLLRKPLCLAFVDAATFLFGWRRWWHENRAERMVAMDRWQNFWSAVVRWWIRGHL